MGTKIALLIDLNSFPRPLTNGDNNLEESPSNTQLNLKWLREFILDRMTKDATIREIFEPTDFQWTFKFFDSSQPTDLHSGKRFFPFDLASFELFEEELDKAFHTFLASGKGDPEVSKLQNLSSAIKNIMSDLTWDGAFTPNRSNNGPGSAVKTNGNAESSKRNFIYAFFRVPRNEDELATFVDNLSSMASSQNFVNALLPKAFFMELHRKHKVRLNFVDMWYFHENFGLPPEEIWNSGCAYMKPIPNVLQYLGGGKVYPVTKRKVEPELPPWIDILKGLLKSKSNISPFIEPKNMKHEQNKNRSLVCRRSASFASNSSKGSGSGDVFGSTAADSAKKKQISPISCSKSELLARSNSAIMLRSDAGDLVPYHRPENGRRYGHSCSREANLGFNGTVAIPNTSYLQMINPKKHILVPQPWVQMVQKEHERAETFKKVLALPAPTRHPTPKKVRRNLFSTQKTDHKDIQTLIALASNTNFTRSPSLPSVNIFNSPGRISLPRPLNGCSPFSATNEARLKVLKSKRRLQLDDEDVNVTRKSSVERERGPVFSPELHLKLRDIDVICPESPSTPPTKKTKRNLTTYLESSEKKVVQESPEVSFAKYSRQSPLKRIDSTSFYSISSCESLKSRAWEKSGIQLKIAKMKESAELSQLATSFTSNQDRDSVD